MRLPSAASTGHRGEKHEKSFSLISSSLTHGFVTMRCIITDMHIQRDFSRCTARKNKKERKPVKVSKLPIMFHCLFFFLNYRRGYSSMERKVGKLLIILPYCLNCKRCDSCVKDHKLRFVFPPILNNQKVSLFACYNLRLIDRFTKAA